MMTSSGAHDAYEDYLLSHHTRQERRLSRPEARPGRQWPGYF